VRNSRNFLRLLHVAHEHPRGASLEVVDRQRKQMAEGPRRKPQIDLVGCVEKKVLADEAEDRFEQQASITPTVKTYSVDLLSVRDDLFDHELEEDGDGKRDDVEREGADRDVRETPIPCRRISGMIQRSPKGWCGSLRR